MAGLQFNYGGGSTPIESPIADKTATGAAVGGLRFNYGDPAPTAPAQKADPNQGDFSRGLDVGALGLQQGFYGARALVRDRWTDNQQGAQEDLQKFQELDQRIAAKSKPTDSITKVEGVGDFIDWAQFTAGQILPSVAGALVSGGTGAVLGGGAGLLAKGAIKKGGEVYARKLLKDKIEKEGLEAATKSAFRQLGAGAAVAGFNLSQSLGQVYPDALEEAAAKGEDVDMAKVYAGGALSAALDTFGDLVGARGIGKALQGGTGGGNMLQRMAKESFVAGMREGVTELMQSGAERWGAGKDLSSPEAIDEYINSFAAGVLGGTMLGSVQGAVARPEAASPAQPPAADVAPDTPDQPAPPMARVGATILVTPELRDKFKDDLVARGIDPESPQADTAIKALEAVERATGVIRARFAAEERSAREKEVEAAFGDTATSGVGVGVGGADTILRRDAVQPDEQNRTLDVLDPNARVTLPTTAWNFSSPATEAVSPEDIVARQEGWEAVPAFEVKPDAQLPASAKVKDGDRHMARNYFPRQADAQQLANYLTETYEGVRARVRQGKRAKGEGAGSYYFVEIKPEDGFQWPLKSRLAGKETAKLGGEDGNTIDMPAADAAPAEQGGTQALAAPARALPAPPVAPEATNVAPAAAPKPSTSAGKPQGKWQASPLAPKIQKIIDDLKAAGLENDAKSVDISSSVDADKGQLDEARVAKRAKWAQGKIEGKKATVAPRGKEKVQSAKPAEPDETEARWTRSTTVERDAWMERAGISKLSRRTVGSKAWKDIGKAAKAKLVAAAAAESDNAARGTQPAPGRTTPVRDAAPDGVATGAADQRAGYALDDGGRRFAAEVRAGINRRSTVPREVVAVESLDAVPEARREEYATAIDLAERVFGRKVVLLDQPGGPLFNGVIRPGQRYIGLYINADRPVLHVIGHELLHSLRGADRQLYRDLLEALRPLLKNGAEDDYAAALAARYGKAGFARLDPDTATEELLADILGNRFAEPEFWNAMEKVTPHATFVRIVQGLLKALDRIMGAITGSRNSGRYDVDKYLTDVEAVRQVLADKLSRWALGELPVEQANIPVPEVTEIDGPLQDELFDMRRTRAAKAVEDLFAEPIKPSKAAMTMNWIITNPVEARSVLGLPPMAAQRWVTKREFGEALDAWRKGKVERDDYSRAAVNKLARALAEEVAWYANYSEDSGIDWYGTKFRRAIDRLAEVEPALKSRDGRGLFTLLLAITSDGTEVQENLGYAMDMFQAFQQGRKLAESTPGQGKYETTYQSNAELVDGLIEEMGLPATIEFLLEPHKVSTIKKEMAKVGTKSPASDYPDDAVLPRAAVYIGPKLGAFYANLMGEKGYLTMDRWWTRTVNRYRGYLTPQPTESSLDELRSLLSRPRTSDEKIIELAEAIAKERQRKYKAAKAEGREYAATKVETLSTTIYKNAKSELNDSPINSDDRAFNIKVVKAAQALLKDKGIDAAIADIQATIWYYEKELFASIGVRGPDRISYEEAASRWIRERGRPAVRGGVRADRGAEAGDGAQRTAELFDLVAEPDAAGDRRTGELAAEPGRVDLVGVHFSSSRRTSLDGRFYGQGLKGAEAARLADSTDPRIRERVYFYVNEGSGIRPEAGVGAYPHRIDARNLYDIQGDPLKLRRADANAMESAILDAGFAGYFVPKVFNGQGVGVIMGPASREIQVQPISREEAAVTGAPAVEERAPEWQVWARGSQDDLQRKAERMRANPSWSNHEIELADGELRVRPLEEVLLSISRDIDRPGWDDRTRKALNEPFNAPAKQTITQRLDGLRSDFLRRFTAAVADPFVAIKDVDDKLYMRARLTNGTDGGLEALLQHGQVFDDGGALNVRKGTKGLLDALRPLGQEVEDFLRWVALNRAAELKKQDRENYFTDESIRLRDKLIEGKMADGRDRKKVYSEALRDLNGLNKSVLELARKNGLIDQAGFDRFSRDIWYIPFYRVAEDSDDEVNAYASAAGLSGQEFSARLKGGKDRVDNLLVNVLRNWGGLLAASQKNGVARDVLAQATQMGGAKQVESGTKGAVKVRVDGREKSYLIEDPLLVDALTSINQAALNNPVLNVFGWFKRVLTGAVTIDPAFKIRNLIRDSIQSIALAGLPFNPIANVIRGFSASDDTRIAALAGGGLFHGHFFGEDDLASKIQRLAAKGIDPSTVITDPLELSKRLLEAYGRGSDRLENVNRVALYEAMRAKGKTHLEAAYAARDLMDFSLQGRSTAVRMLAMTLPFFNARVQGLYKLGRDGVMPTMLTLMGKADAGQRAQAARFSAVAGGVVLATLLLYLINKDDDEFQKREAWDRDNFWWVRIGDTAVRIPKPFEVGAIGTMAERALEQLVDDRVGGKTFAKAVKDMLMNTFAFDPVPQMLRPALGIAANRDAFTDRPIETFAMQQVSKVERFGSATTEPAKAISRVTSAVSSVLPGNESVTLSPAQIDYLARAYFGWLGATVMQSTSALVKWSGPVEAPSSKLDDVLVLGSFVRELPSNQSRYLSEFYESAEKVSQRWQDIKLYQRLGQIDEARRLAEENRDLISMRQTYSRAQRMIADLNAQMRRVTADEKMSGDRKREILDKLSQRKSEIAQRVELMRRARELKAAA